MPNTIRNRAKHLVIVPLNSGTAIHLAPGETSGAIDDLELTDNSKVAKLIRYGMVDVKPEVSPGAAVSGEPSKS